MSRFFASRIARLSAATFAALTPLMGAVALSGVVAAPAHAQYSFADLSKNTEPSIILPRTAISLQRNMRYRPDPNKEPIYFQWSWSPRFKIGLRGPVSAGAQLVVNVTKPNGAAWLSLPVETPELAAGAWQDLTTPDQDETKGITGTGTYGFSVVLKNPLDGSKKVLYTGKFDVSKFKYPTGTHPGETEFFVNYDWLLPTGYIEINTENNEEAPLLSTYFWFKGDESANNPEGYVLYNGKLIYSTKSEGQGRGIADVTLTTPGVDKNRTWFRWKFSFGGVRIYHSASDQSANTYTQHFLTKNPGQYEVKVLRGGQPARSMKFTVGADGQIVNNGLAVKNHLSTTMMLMPVEIFPGTDVPYSLAPTPGAFFGNPWQMK